MYWYGSQQKTEVRRPNCGNQTFSWPQQLNMLAVLPFIVFAPISDTTQSLLCIYFFIIVTPTYVLLNSTLQVGCPQRQYYLFMKVQLL